MAETIPSVQAPAGTLGEPEEQNIELASLRSTDAVIDIGNDELDPNQNADENEAVGIDGDETVENDVGPTDEELDNPNLLSFMTACQKGEVEIVKELISSGTVTANETFSTGITGLHWAAINDRLPIVQYLCENEFSKSDPNILAGDLKASPLHWACRQGLTYVVDYFLCNTDSDPSLRDAQSYNALHLAVHSSNIMLVIYLVIKCCSGSNPRLYIDEPDASNRTSLHWAAYQGDMYTVNTLLKFGADVGKVDNTLFIPLHWAFMRGSKQVLKSLVEAKSDIFLKNDKGKDSFDIAKDMNCYGTWVSVLGECGIYESNGWVFKSSIIDEKTAKGITFFLPYFILPAVFNICSFGNGWAIPKLFASVVLILSSGLFLVKIILPTYIRESRALGKSPFLAGIFSATTFWCIITWLYNIVPVLWWNKFFTNLLLGASIAIVCRTFLKAMLINPGYVPTPSDNKVIYGQIKELIKIGVYDAHNFSIESYVRKPLRSRYSKASNKLIARFDHYCPWVYNEIGVRNHKLFMTFVYSLFVGIFLWIHLTIRFFDKYEGGKNSGYDSDDDTQQCLFLLEDLCVGYRHNHFQFNLLVWCSLQLIWVGFLQVSQTFQIFKGITTWEFSLLTENRSSGRHGHAHNDGFTTFMKLVGIDQFIMTIKVFIQSFFVAVETHTQYNPLGGNEFEVPTDYGWRTNWLDFWFLGEYKWRNLFYLPIEGENNLNGKVVDYYKLYEYPSKSASTLV